jgi:hypothetical protein
MERTRQRQRRRPASNAGDEEAQATAVAATGHQPSTAKCASTDTCVHR